MNTTSDKMIEITEFTDPVCTWCWGSEPVLWKLETRFGEQVKISYIMGGDSPGSDFKIAIRAKKEK